MKTTLPKKIETVEEAQNFLLALRANGESYHPEDDAAQIVNGKTGKDMFTKAEAKKVNTLMAQVHALKGFDPCQLLLDADKKFFFTDKARAGGNYSVSLFRVRSGIEMGLYDDLIDELPEGEDEVKFHEWIEDAEIGDTLETSTQSVTRTE